LNSCAIGNRNTAKLSLTPRDRALINVQKIKTLKAVRRTSLGETNDWSLADWIKL